MSAPRPVNRTSRSRAHPSTRGWSAARPRGSSASSAERGRGLGLLGQVEGDEQAGGPERGQVEGGERQAHAGVGTVPGDAAAAGQLAPPEDRPHGAGHVLADLAREVPRHRVGPARRGPGQGHRPAPAGGDPGHGGACAEHRSHQPADLGVGDLVADLGPLRRQPVGDEPDAHRGDRRAHQSRGRHGPAAAGRAPRPAARGSGRRPWSPRHCGRRFRRGRYPGRRGSDQRHVSTV